ncbi:phosphoethanolamine transferase EptA [Pectobacterium parmentieri]|uniref:phosphoethanolamine transferase EptA n=1 Tax=Pectobacterium parmentieri TaxID=1905730 RepID=UPI0018DF422D|nr:phosphoethanolamine transferase EptA [Pectobacterium parmentieri]MBI0548841.1 phosphoethanolamine transferase EptA [Pectobacterium parmentieri]MBI0557861.1 phosphoethanolamine transferase EptA [Pectobacterium parmentieri]MBI0561914.1 phosphoethanolamine transferase EptA [Pectobacterium parmentieri]
MKNLIPMGRPHLNSITFVLIFSAFITLAQNIAYYRQALQLLDMTDWSTLLFFLSMPVVIFAVLNILFTLLAAPYLRKAVIVFFLLTGAAAQYFMLNYGIIIDRTMIQNLVETTASESFSLLTPQLVAWVFFLGVIPAVLAIWIKIKPAKPTTLYIGMRVLSVIISLFAILSVAAFFYKDYASFMRNNKELVKAITPSNIVAASLSYHKHSALANLPLEQIGLDAHKVSPPSPTAKKNLVILVVGETSRAQNFSLGGYGKETNPLLAKDNVVYFENTSSCGTSTGVSVPCMFSNMPRQSFNGDVASHQEGLLDILQRAKVNVLWQENDGGCKDVCTRVPTVDVTSLKLPGLCTNGECHDEALFHGVEDYINKLDNDGIIVLHTIGSHGPSYYQRYPDAFKKFTPTCDTNQIQTCTQEALTNTYDNTILYVDFFLDKTINLLKQHQDKFNTSLVYLSDHGESLGENGIYLHSMPYSIAPKQQTHVPMLIWLSTGYQQKQAIQDTCLRQSAKQQDYSQDNLFHTILGMFTIATKEYQPQLDILQPCRDKAT